MASREPSGAVVAVGMSGSQVSRKPTGQVDAIQVA